MSSLKNLFEKNLSSQLSKVSKEDLSTNIESENYIDAHIENRDKFIPDVDFSDPKNFAKFGLAERYYLDGIKTIYNTYPYDGSKKEKTEWETNLSFLEKYIFENEYPRQNGYAIFRTGSYTTITSSDGYNQPNSYEYILTKGGPGIGKTTTRDDNNIFDVSNYQECNLRIGNENTVEFYLKKAAFSSSNEVIFDAWTTSSVSSSDGYGRLRIELFPTASGSPWGVTWMSGSFGTEAQIIGANLSTSSVADDSWHHYCFRFKNSGSTCYVDLFMDGEYNDTKTFAGPVSYVSGTVVSTIGAICVAPSGNNDVSRGWGPLSGSIDEFRFWKNWRTSKEIERNYFDNVYGGTNTDDANTELGIYYKFNEGITQTSSYDSIVLDYSGRVSNGTWVGYSSGQRNTGSAIVLGGFAEREFLDPTIYSNHPDVVTLVDEKRLLGREWDERNSSSLHKTLPAWLLEEQETIDRNDQGEDSLVQLTQIMGSYFDTIEQQIRELPKIKNGTYISSSAKPYPFYEKLLKSEGFDIPDFLNDVSVYEFFNDKNDNKVFEEKLVDIKNTIYQNIYNNLVSIYKSKGTEKGFRNLLRCFGVDDQLFRLNIYAQNNEFEFKDNYFVRSEYKNYANFNKVENSDATVFGFYDSSNSNSNSYISGTGNTSSLYEASGLSFTLETDIIFPKRYSINEYNTYLSSSGIYSKTYPLMLTSSLFGMHSAKDSASDLTWATNDYADVQVMCIKDNLYSDRGYFKASGSLFGEISSSYINDLYTDSRWNIYLSIYPKPFSFLFSGSSEYTVELSGKKMILDSVDDSFSVTGTITVESGSAILSSHKRIYCGAHKTNFTGSTLIHSDVKVGEVKALFSKLTENEKKSRKDVNSTGFEFPQNSTFQFDNLSGSFLPKNQSVVLHWNFSNLTSSNSSGEFSVNDLTSGSSEIRDRYPIFGNILGYQHTAKGYEFATSSTESIIKEYIISAKKELPEYVYSSDLVNVLTRDDTNFNISKKLNTYFMLIEKSMYSVISDEMLKMFATTKDFGSLIGKPALKYRQENKDIDLLRHLFFEKVDNIPDIEKFIDYFKWLDAAITYCLTKMMPASSNLSEEYVRNVIENHILERNKHKYAFPFFNDKKKGQLTSVVIGSKENEYNWKYGHATSDSTSNCTWQELRARAGTFATDIKVNSNNESADSYSGSNGLYSGSTFEKRYFSQLNTIRGDLNRNKNTINSYVDAKIIKVTGSEDVGYVLDLSNTGSAICTDYSDLERKVKIKNVKVYSIGESENSSKDNVIQIRLYSGSSVDKKVTNIHRDLYLDYDQEPMQSPWTEKFVGGKQTRHLEIGATQRPESFYLLESGSDFRIYSPKKYGIQTLNLFREELIKRNVDLKNKPLTTSSNGATLLGNYQRNYEILNTAGRNENNRYFVKNEGLSISGNFSPAISGIIDFQIPTRTVSGNYGSHVFVTRFSALGSPETDSEGFLDIESGEYSIYNTINERNQIVRSVYNSSSTKHCGQFGYDSEFVGTLLPSTMTGTYENTASFHKVHHNRKLVFALSGSSSTDTTTKYVYDNLFIQNVIPRAEHQYNWISSSMIPVGPTNLSFGFQTPNFSRQDLASSDYPNRVSGSSVSNGTVLLVGLNTLIEDQYSEETRVYSVSLGTPTTASAAERLYVINNYRNGNTSWAPWKQIRNDRFKLFEESNNLFYFDINGEKVFAHDTPINTSYRNINIETVITKNDGKLDTKFISIPFGNELIKVSRLIDIDRSIVEKDFFQESNYNKKYKITSDYIFKNYDVKSLEYSELIYPRENFVGFNETRRRDSYQNNFWRTLRSDRETFVSKISGTYFTSSIWPLDARKNFSTTASYSVSGANGKLGEGELQNSYTLFHLGNKSGIGVGALYSRRIEETLNGTVIYSGDTLWEGNISGSSPFYNTYNEFVDDIARKGKDYSIVPEFRISDLMTTYLDVHNGNFLADIDSFLSITGSSLVDTSEVSFYEKYSTTEFMKYFDFFVDELDKENMKQTKLRLTCKALTKLNPYDGFYPAQRATQLATLFSQSFGEFITVTGSDMTSPAATRPVIQPLFTPGILFNTIKSGIAVDYPIYVNSSPTITGSILNTSSDDGIPRLKDNFDYRVPFEAIIEPASYLKGLRIVDQEPHPSASIYVTATLNGAGSDAYKLAANNFFAESINLFLKDGNLTTVSSLPDSDPNFGNVEAGKKYMMRFVCSHSKYRQQKDIDNVITEIGVDILTSQSYEWNPPTITMYKNLGSGSGYTQEKNVYGASFGPPVDSNNAAVTISASYNPFTPPYHGGYSDITLTFAPTASGKITIDNLLTQLTMSYLRYDYFTFASTTADSQYNKMQISASFNLFQKVTEKQPIFDSNGNISQINSTGQSTRWVVQPKFETPILDFSNCSVTVPVSGAAGISRGMWHQLGEIPTSANKGLFFEVQDLRYDELTDPTLTGSLADLVGFKKGARKIGQIREKFTMKEAIIAIPFYTDINGKEQNFGIPRKIIENAELFVNGQKELYDLETKEYPNVTPSQSIIDMVSKMKEFVIPPKFDFLTNKEINPMTMYIFDFEMSLDQDDLSKIWQNVAPKQVYKASELERTIEHDLSQFTNNGFDMLAEIKNNIQWLVFKVKQKASWNYFSKTADTNDDVKFSFKNGKKDSAKEFEPNYSYNWPYDYCSIVELANIESGIKFGKKSVETAPPLKEDEQLQDKSGVFNSIIDPYKFLKDKI